MVWIILGEPKPFSAHSTARIRIRSISGFFRKVSGSTSGRYGLGNPIFLAPSGIGIDTGVKTLGVVRAATQWRIDKAAGRSYLRKTTAGSTVLVMTKPRLDSDVEVSSYVAGVAVRLHERLAELSSELGRFLEDQIPELRGDAALMELLGTSVEANVHTVLHALRLDIVVERVEAPTAALEYARRLAQHGVPVNALVRAYRLGPRFMNELVFAEVCALALS